MENTTSGEIRKNPKERKSDVTQTVVVGLPREATSITMHTHLHINSSVDTYSTHKKYLKKLIGKLKVEQWLKFLFVFR